MKKTVLTFGLISGAIRPDRTPLSLLAFAGVIYRLKVGRCTTSVDGTVSSRWPALRQAARPPAITNVANPCSRKRCATLALVASLRQVQ